ncbi:MAG: homoserine dehydrogenase [Clostridiales bacterium]|jgi:homoserine dehydrogenase|nr:homoserine dehydrogenase [Clostridiales bacterium]
MLNIAILGYGVVGSGVYEVIKLNKELISKRVFFKQINVKYILDIHDFKGEEIENLVTNNINDILDDDSVELVVETMGGLKPAYGFVKSALLRGKSVVTSNKELVAAHGAELLEIAMAKEINFLFEASAGGGIPIIRSIKQALTADDIFEMKGILNGTTNYILTKMTRDGIAFEEALKRAQEKGYAEKDPADDIGGVDTGRKLAILLSLISGKSVDYDDLEIRGIESVKPEDIAFAKEIGGVFRLIASAKKLNGAYSAAVMPVILRDDSPLYGIHSVFNSILLKGNAVNELMFYGKGAGKMPTASAVVGDIIDALRHDKKNIGYFWSKEKQEIVSFDYVKHNSFVRVKTNSRDKLFEELINWGVETVISHTGYPEDAAFVTKSIDKAGLSRELDILKDKNLISGVCNIFSIEYEVQP